MKPFQATARTIRDGVLSGELAVDDVLGFYRERAERFAAGLNCLLFRDDDWVRDQAQALKERLESGERPSLAGVPVVLKDNIVTKGVPTTCGSRMLADYCPPYDAHVVEALRAAGAIFIGKANCDEFAMGSSNEHSAFGAAKNPWDLDRVPGGSSGGSAAAVAADLAPVALGSDTGGSIRQPAAFCGVTGLKPTYGRVSRYGLVAFASSLDQIGPVTRTIDDAALVLEAISSPDQRDSTHGFNESFRVPEQPSQGERPPRIGVLRSPQDAHVMPGVREAFDQALASLREAGAEVQEVALPSLDAAVAAYYVLAPAEASANLARYDGVRYGFRPEDPNLSLKRMVNKARSEGFGREVKQRIMIGAFALSAGYYDDYYEKAQRARSRIAAECERAFEDVDLLVSPTAPVTAFRVGEKQDDPLAMYMTDVFTVPANLAGLPALSLPCGKDDGGLPVGLQMMAARGDEAGLLGGARWYEQASKWRSEPPGFA